MIYKLDCIIQLGLVVRRKSSVDLQLVAQRQAHFSELRFVERLHVDLRCTQLVLVEDSEEVFQLELRQPLKQIAAALRVLLPRQLLQLLTLPLRTVVAGTCIQ